MKLSESQGATCFSDKAHSGEHISHWGPLLQSYGYKAAFTFAAVPASLVLVPVTMGCLQEKRLSAEDLSRT